MKKIGVLFSLLFLVILVSGCEGSNVKTLTCSATKEGNMINADSEYVFKFKDDKLTKINFNVVFKDFTISDIDTNWDSYVETFTKQNEPVDEAGYKRTVSADKKNHRFTVNMEIDLNKLSDDTAKKYNFNKDDFQTYDQVKELFAKTENTDEVYTCK